MRNIFPKFRFAQGFTLVETLVAISIFVIVMGISTSILTDALASNRRIEVSRMLYEESRIALERIAKEMRKGTLDYEEYWNRHKHKTSSTSNSDYGKNYGDYALQFLRDSVNPNNIPAMDDRNTNPSNWRMNENVGLITGGPAIGDARTLAVCGATSVPIVPDSSRYQQCELYLIAADGTEKTIIKVVPESIRDLNGATRNEYRLKMLKMGGRDTGGDGIIDIWGEDGGTWHGPADFKGYTFQKIQPDSIKITSLKFFVSPLDDPRKAFANFNDAVQIQPQVTILLTAEPSQLYARGIKGKIPTIAIQTTITARAQNEVKSLQ